MDKQNALAKIQSECERLQSLNENYEANVLRIDQIFNAARGYLNCLYDFDVITPAEFGDLSTKLVISAYPVDGYMLEPTA